MFEWEESTFLGLKSLYQRFVTSPKKREEVARRASLAQHRLTLVYLARLLSGKNVGIFETDAAVLCQDERVCLPSHFHAAASPTANQSLYELKTMLAALALRDQWQGTPEMLPGFLQSFCTEFPGLKEKFHYVEEQLIVDSSLWELFGVPASRTAADSDGGEIITPDDPAPSSEITTEIEGRGQADVSVIADTGDDGDGADLPIHTFEKTEALEETSGLNRKRDDEDELEDHQEALQEVDMREVLRSQERPKSIYRSDLILDQLSFEVNESSPATGIPYPEWDYKKRKYRPSWCHLQTHAAQQCDPAWMMRAEAKHAALIHRLKKQFAAITSTYLQTKRQPSGPEFDLDALVDCQVRIRAGSTPTEQIYQDRKKDLHDLAAVILLDLSFSTDAWVRGARVLDSIMETVLCVGNVIDENIASFAVAGFSSNTRRSCRYEVFKNFHEPWEGAKPRLGGPQPQGYTRIGPALRHSHELLLNQQAARKTVILVTDGRPCDYDRYEGLYGIKDVRKAIESGKLHGIQTHAFAIEKQATETFPQMFSRDHFDVVPTPDDLIRHLSRLFARLLTA